MRYDIKYNAHKICTGCKLTYEMIPYKKIRTKYGIKLFHFRLGLREDEV